jgi:hypothetical protein
MFIPSLTAVRQFIGTLSDPDERLKHFFPLTLKPWDLSQLLDKMRGIYDPCPTALPPADRVVIGSEVHLIDVLNYSELEITVTLPEDSDPARGRISVLAPLGAAVLGLDEGDTFSVFIGNRMARFRIVDVFN